jgi:hypothetical protein
MAGTSDYRTSFFKFLTDQPSVYDVVFSCLSPAEVYRVRRVCRQAKAATSSFLLRAYNIDRHLSYYFDNPSDFRRCQEKTGALIAGSNALQLLDRSFYPESDMDIYADVRFCQQMADFLTLDAGYEFEPTEGQLPTVAENLRPLLAHPRLWMRGAGPLNISISNNPDNEYGSGVSLVMNFTKQGKDLRMRSVQLMAATGGPLNCILHFHSSA